MPELSLFQYILASVASAILVRIIISSVNFFRCFGERERLLNRLIATLNLKQYINEWKATREALGDSFALTLPALIGKFDIKFLPDFIVEPEYYDPFSSSFNDVLPLQVLKEVVKKLANPHVEYLAHGVVDAMTLLVEIYRRRQLAMRELKLNGNHRERTQSILDKLNQHYEQVRSHLAKLAEAYASATQNATWPHELQMHNFDMSDFHDRLDNYQNLFDAELPDLEVGELRSAPCREIE